MALPAKSVCDQCPTRREKKAVTRLKRRLEAPAFTPGQPLAERVLSAAVYRPAPPQQLLLYGPRGSGKRRAARAAVGRRVLRAVERMHYRCGGHQRHFVLAAAPATIEHNILCTKLMSYFTAIYLPSSHSARTFFKYL